MIGITNANAKGGGPETYIKSASVSGNTLTLVDQDNVETRFTPAPIVTQNIEIHTADWVSSGLDNYGYSVNITVQGAEAGDISTVTFDIEDADSGNFASVCDTDDGIVTIYAKEAQDVTIPNILTIKTGIVPPGPIPEVELPFDFGGNTLYRYKGTEESLYVPTSYSVRQRYIDLPGVELNPTFETGWQNLLPSQKFAKLAFRNNVTGTIYEYGTYSKYLSQFEENFPDKSQASLYYAEVPDPSDSGALIDMSAYFVFPIVTPFGTYANISEYATYISKQSDLNSLAFGGTITETYYIEGDDIAVTAIAPTAFQLSSNLITVVIPECIESIGELAFNLCGNLTKVLFEYPYDWWVGSEPSSLETLLDYSDLEDSTTAAQFLTSDYVDKYWTKAVVPPPPPPPPTT